MRKIIVVMLVLLLTVFVAGCGKSPSTVTGEFLAAMKVADFEKAALNAEVSDKNTVAGEFLSDEKSEKYGKLILSKASYVVGEEKIEGDKATVKVKVTAIDMVRVATKAMSELMPMAFASAFSGDDEESKKKMDAMMDQYFENSIADPEAPKVTKEVDVNLVKTKDGWKVAKDNEQLFDAYVGGAASAFK